MCHTIVLPAQEGCTRLNPTILTQSWPYHASYIPGTRGRWSDEAHLQARILIPRAVRPSHQGCFYVVSRRTGLERTHANDVDTAAIAKSSIGWRLLLSCACCCLCRCCSYCSCSCCSCSSCCRCCWWRTSCPVLSIFAAVAGDVANIAAVLVPALSLGISSACNPRRKCTGYRILRSKQRCTCTWYISPDHRPRARSRPTRRHASSPHWLEDWRRNMSNFRRRLKMLNNKCYSSCFLLNKLVFPPHTFSPTTPDIFPRLCQEPRWDSPVFNIQCDFFGIAVTCNDLILYCRCIASIVVFQVVEFYMFLKVRKSHFFLFFFWERRWESNQRPPWSIISRPVCDAIVRR